MSSREYWRQREDEALRKYQKSEAEYAKEIKQIYKNMLDGCQTEIDAFYGRYAKAEGISIAEAKRRVSKLDIEKYERKAARYVKDKDFSQKANEEMRLYNATMKINRLEMLKANIGLELIKGHDELDKFMGGILKGRTEEELRRQAGILGKTIRNNAQLAHTIPNASFHNATFSDRIWQYQDLMREDLSKILSRGLIQGKNPRAIARDLQKYWYGNDPKTGGGAVYCMERLMRTEMARVQTEAQKQSLEKNGFTEYEFIANADCCGICKALDGKHFKVSKMMPGENAAPIHPHCRCSVAAYEDSDEYEAWLNYLEKGGTTAEFEKMKAAKNETDRQAQIRARREGYHNRKTTSQNVTQPYSPDFDSMDRKQLTQWASSHLKTEIDFKGATEGVVKTVTKALYDFEKIGGNLDGVKVVFSGIKGRYGAYDYATKTLFLRPTDTFVSRLLEENTRASRKLHRVQWADPSYRGMMFHEIGHAVDHSSGSSLSKIISNSSKLLTDAFSVSNYARTTPAIGQPRASEAFAECFSAYMKDKSSVSPEIAEMIEDYLKKRK